MICVCGLLSEQHRPGQPQGEAQRDDDVVAGEVDAALEQIGLGDVENYGLDLSGNWMECKFDKIEMTTSSNGTAVFRHNGNMGGSVITAPEIEDAAANLNNYSYVEIGPFATEGPQTVGGFWTTDVQPWRLALGGEGGQASDVDLGRLEDNVEARRDEIDYLSNLVNEYGTALQVLLGIPLGLLLGWVAAREYEQRGAETGPYRGVQRALGQRHPALEADGE